jgi:hypothetical protein
MSRISLPHVIGHQKCHKRPIIGADFNKVREWGGWGGQKVLSRPSADSFAVGRRQKSQQRLNNNLSSVLNVRLPFCLIGLICVLWPFDSRSIATERQSNLSSKIGIEHSIRYSICYSAFVDFFLSYSLCQTGSALAIDSTSIVSKYD